MSDAVRQIFVEWQLPIGLTASVLLAGLIYVRGWLAMRRTRRNQFTVERMASFLSGLALMWTVVGSPMDGFADALLTMHMVEHLLLMSAIPMLLLYGLPVAPMLRGLPRPVLRWVVGPLLRTRSLRRLVEWLVTPVVAWLAMNIAYLAWHVPAAYNLALENETVHDLEHLCFFFTSLLFWWYILRPWPAKERPDDWGMLIYLAMGDVVMTMLSAFLAFCGQPVYSYYVEHPNPFHIPVLEDQVMGAVVMWVIGSFAYLVPAMAIAYRLTGGTDHGSQPRVVLPRISG
ncbi:MAG: cytochrome c oxidase assembly protein [Acidobacteriaceae bacterium]